MLSTFLFSVHLHERCLSNIFAGGSINNKQTREASIYSKFRVPREESCLASPSAICSRHYSVHRVLDDSITTCGRRVDWIAVRTSSGTPWGHLRYFDFSHQPRFAGMCSFRVQHAGNEVDHGSVGKPCRYSARASCCIYHAINLFSLSA